MEVWDFGTSFIVIIFFSVRRWDGLRETRQRFEQFKEDDQKREREEGRIP